MKINKVSVIMDIEGTPAMVLFDAMDDEKRQLFAHTISAFCKDPGVLSMIKLSDDYSFVKTNSSDFNK
jgi:hypothetical protein